MKKGTKKLVVQTLKDRIRQYEIHIKSCENAPFDMTDHIAKLIKKTESLNAAIEELEAI